MADLNPIDDAPSAPGIALVWAVFAAVAVIGGGAGFIVGVMW